MSNNGFLSLLRFNGVWDLVQPLVLRPKGGRQGAVLDEEKKKRNAVLMDPLSWLVGGRMTFFIKKNIIT